MNIAWVDEAPALDTIDWLDEKPEAEAQGQALQKTVVDTMFKTVTGLRMALPPIEAGKMVLEQFERPISGLRAVSKGESFGAGFKTPEKYPVGTFGESLAEVGISPIVAGSLGTIADVGYYFGMPEAIVRIASAGKIKLLEESIVNINEALSTAGRDRIHIGSKIIEKAAKNKDVFSVVRNYLKSKGLRFPRTNKLLEYDASYEQNVKVVAEQLKKTELRPDIINAIAKNVAENRMSDVPNPIIEGLIENPAKLSSAVKAFEVETGQKLTKEPIKVSEVGKAEKAPVITPKVAKTPIVEPVLTPTAKGGEILNDLNPTGGVFASYTSEARAKMPLGENITTLDKTMGKSSDEVVTIYRGGGEIVAGDFITTNKQLAKDYAGTGKVYEKKVKLSDILDDKTEPLGEEYIYRPKLSPKEGVTKVRGLAKGVEEKAIENKLTESLGDLPEYQAINMKDQSVKAQDLLTKDYELAKRIAMGQELPPNDILPESVFVAVENKAIKEGDVETIRNLATASELTTEATTMGQRIRTLAERDPESPVTAIKGVAKAREQRVGDTKKAKKETVSSIKKEIKKLSPTKETWADFMRSIQC